LRIFATDKRYYFVGNCNESTDAIAIKAAPAVNRKFNPEIVLNRPNHESAMIAPKIVEKKRTNSLMW
jgi:hypothetical protein